MLVGLFVIAVYLSFALDFLLFPIPSEASTNAILSRSEQRFSPDKVLLRLAHAALLALWLLPLIVAIVAVLSPVLSSASTPSTEQHGAWHSVTITIGILLTLIGRGVTLLASHTVRQAQPGRLVNSSVFAYSRHPIVVGLHLTLAGLLCLSQYPFALCLLPATWLYFDKKIRIEEQALLARLGEEYTHYQNSTRRYLPVYFNLSGRRN